MKLLIFVSICGKIQEHFVISTFKTKIKNCLRFDVYAMSRLKLLKTHHCALCYDRPFLFKGDIVRFRFCLLMTALFLPLCTLWRLHLFMFYRPDGTYLNMGDSGDFPLIFGKVENILKGILDSFPITFSKNSNYWWQNLL